MLRQSSTSRVVAYSSGDGTAATNPRHIPVIVQTDRLEAYDMLPAPAGDRLTRYIQRGALAFIKGVCVLVWCVMAFHAKGKTLVYGTANPEGMNGSYSGVYLNMEDVSSMVEQVGQANRSGAPIPVKLEHTGVAMGRVVSAWENRGTLECVLEIDESVLEGSIGAEFLRTGICKDLSLGYTVDMEQPKKTGRIRSRCKKLNEISVVVKGARKNCKVHGMSKR